MSEFDRMTFAPDIMAGRACIRGMRITVSLILNLVANGMTIEEIMDAYPYLEQEDIQQALQITRTDEINITGSRQWGKAHALTD